MKEKLDWSPRNWVGNLGALSKVAGNILLYWLSGRSRHPVKSFNPVLSTALEGQACRSDIADHLSTIFYFAANPGNRLIVELGTRGGESTRALLAAAAVSNASMLSVDIDDCSRLDLPFRDRWQFVKADDVEFGRGGFSKWCDSNGLDPRIDVLFIDTSHEYAHTKQEVATWMQHLAEQAVVILHDTNMGNGIYTKLGGGVGIGWDNERGVIRAVEEFLGKTYDENSFFSDVVKGFKLLHFPYSNGLTILQRTRGD